jgi:hypothetical protein
MIMAVKKKPAQSGQALIELIIFLPLMFALYGMISGFANAINGSINQQKVTRAYFYFRVQNSSMVPKPNLSEVNNWNKFGMFYVGWADHFVGKLPVMPCYKVSIPLPSNGVEEDCEKDYDSESTQYIRVGTAYGICGATFQKSPSDGTYFLVPDMDGSVYQELLDVSSCTIR